MGDFSTFPGLGGSGVPADLLNLGYPISGGPTLSDFVVPLEAVAGGGGGAGFVDISYVDPNITAPTPTAAAPIDPTLGTAIDLGYTATAAPATQLGTGIIDPSTIIDPMTGLPLPSTVFTATGTTSSVDLATLQGLPLINNIPPSLIASPVSFVPPTTDVNKVAPTPVSVFDPSLLPTLPTLAPTSTAGILPPVAAPAPPKPGVLSSIGKALQSALGGTGGGSGGGAAGTAAKPGQTATQAGMTPQTGTNLLMLVLVGAVLYAILRKR